MFWDMLIFTQDWARLAQLTSHKLCVYDTVSTVIIIRLNKIHCTYYITITNLTANAVYVDDFHWKLIC